MFISLDDPYALSRMIRIGGCKFCSRNGFPGEYALCCRCGASYHKHCGYAQDIRFCSKQCFDDWFDASGADAEKLS